MIDSEFLGDDIRREIMIDVDAVDAAGAADAAAAAAAAAAGGYIFKNIPYMCNNTYIGAHSALQTVSAQAVADNTIAAKV